MPNYEARRSSLKTKAMTHTTHISVIVIVPFIAVKIVDRLACHDACDRGGFRSGKRPCMRRVIEYIASDFRKDKFWLRRVEPSKRQYQVMIAVDDSASMVFNHSKQVLSSCAAGFLKKLYIRQSFR